MRVQGRLTEWNDDRGFGFITPLDGGARAFAHVSQFPQEKLRPMLQDLVTYEPGSDERNRPRANDIQFLTVVRGRHDTYTTTTEVGGLGLPLGMSVALVLVLTALVVLGDVPRSVFAVYGFMSALAFVSYGSDKAAAQKGRWRTSEASLHLMSLLGGWPGALFGQRVYRHKTQKREFQLIFWLTVLANLAGLTAIAAAFASQAV